MAIIYLDNNATTKPFPEVVEAMTQFMASRYWNVSSAYGQLDGLEDVVESAKKSIRSLLGATLNDEVVFTSGATESNVWAIAEGVRKSARSGYILTSQIEHPSVNEVLISLQAGGREVRWVPVTKCGTFDLEALTALVDSDLSFASLMFAHNETGVIQPLREAIALIRERAPHCLIHTDATQALGKVPLNFSGELDEVDLISFSGHKFYGPKGIGGLVIRNKTKLQPLILGGGQQNNLRSGTLNIPAIVGISVAAQKSLELLQKEPDSKRKIVRDHFEDRLKVTFPNCFFVGSHSPRLPNTSFFGIPGTDSDDLVHALAAEGIALSKGSSCSAQSVKPSNAALSMGYSYEEAASLIRFSSSFDTSVDELNLLLSKLLQLTSTDNT